MEKARMMSCKKVAQLMHGDQLCDASRWVRFRVKLHLWMCKHCARLAKQLEILSVGARQLAVSTDREKAGEGEDSLEARLLRRLGGE